MSVEVEPIEGWFHETFSGFSRFLNGVLRGDGAVTLSARCGDMAGRGLPLGKQLAWFIDLINFEQDHCEKYRVWHVKRKLLLPLERDTFNV